MTLIPSTRGRITDAIPAVIIQNICEELEHVPREEVQPETPPPPSIALEKYLKNRDIHAVSQVCKSWRLHAGAFMCLWRDIAFDVTELKSTRLATSFLSLVRDQDVLLRIYVMFGVDDLYDPDPEFVGLLDSLRRITHRWLVFECQGDIGKFQSYLVLPAPNLRYFSDHGDFSPNTRQPFAGRVPSLRYLLASSTSGWDSTILPNLTEFRFDRSTCGPPPSLSSLLDLFQGTPGLETLRLECLGSFIHDCSADANVSLPRLRALHSHNTDFDVLVEHISIPNVREATFTADTPTHPSFQAPHALTGLSSLSILTQPISEVIVVVARPSDQGTFRIRLTTLGGSFFDLCLILDTNIMQHWKDYITRTISALAERIGQDPGVILRLYLGISPSLRLSSRGALKVHGGFARKFFAVVAGTETPPVITPPLACHLHFTRDEPAVNEDETQMFRLCLRSRATCEVGLSVRVRHDSAPWLRAADYECPDGCMYALRNVGIVITDPFRR